MSEEKLSSSDLMLEALRESQKALPDCLPNPPVGCVIAKDHQIVSSGYTQAPGSKHAEAMALENVPKDLRGYQIYVTLEPCSFHGQTPSCAQEIAQRKPDHVFIAAIDPDPRNNGRGVEILMNAEIDVTVGTCEEPVLGFISPYLQAADQQ